MEKLPYYEVHYLNVKDADAILIRYIDNSGNAYIVSIDAGNVADGHTIKNYIQKRWNTTTIDLAVCTHPDSDHKGGFFNLLNDPDVKIDEIWINTPENVIQNGEYYKKYPQGDYYTHSRTCYSHPTDSTSANLIDLAIEKGCVVKCVYEGESHPNLPLHVIGPTRAFYKPLAFEILKGQKRQREEDNSSYEDIGMVSESATATAINNTPDDSSPTNAGSIILLFNPAPNKKFLFLGDANRAAIENVLQHYDLEYCIVKVPHHGSISNMSTSIMDRLKPSSAIISAKGSKTHPNTDIVEYLSIYSRVYSTHKNKGMNIYFTPYPPKNPATPLKEKRTLKLIPRKNK